MSNWTHVAGGWPQRDLNSKNLALKCKMSLARFREFIEAKFG